MPGQLEVRGRPAYNNVKAVAKHAKADGIAARNRRSRKESVAGDRIEPAPRMFGLQAEGRSEPGNLAV